MSYCTCKLRHAVCPTERKWVKEALADARQRGDRVGIRGIFCSGPAEQVIQHPRGVVQNPKGTPGPRPFTHWRFHSSPSV